MAIVMKVLVLHHLGESDLICPIFICDECSKEIDDPNVALAVWDRIPIGGNQQIKIVHKGKCDKAIRLTNSRELSEFIEQLRRNTLMPITWHPKSLDDNLIHPIIPAKKCERNGEVWVIDCPYCGKEHRHAAEPGHRASHCNKGDGYIITWPEQNTSR